MTALAKQSMIIAIIGICLIGFVHKPVASQTVAKPELSKAQSSTNLSIRFDATQPGQGDDAIAGHPDFAWRQGWVETPQWGGRIASLDVSGTLRVKLRDPDTSPWVVVAHNVKDFQVMDWRIAVLKTTGALLFAEGPLNTPLKLIAENVQAFQLTLTRIGILQTDGTFLLRDHGFTSREVAKGVKMFQVSTERIALLTKDGRLWAHDHGYVSALKQVADNVERFQIEREWVALVRNNRLEIAKGDLDKLQFVEHGSDVAEFQMEVTVDLGERPRSRMHLAMATRKGQVFVGESEQPRIPLQLIGGFNVKTLSWAGRQLAIHSVDGSLAIGRLRDDDATFEGLNAAGTARNFRLNQEGDLLLDRGTGALRVAKSTQKVPGSATSVDVKSGAAAGASGERAIRRLDLSTETELPRTAGTIDRLAISSMRPEYTRRAIAVTP